MALLEKFIDVPQDVYNHTINNYVQNSNRVFASTRYEHSTEGGYMPENLGKSTGYGDEGVVLKDAQWGGNKLSSDQKGIIEAHEKVHGLFWHLTEGERKFILSPFDMQKLSLKYKHRADEVLARMSQLKNYFGFTSLEVFTVEHARYARKHYVEDTGMDNGISNMMDSIQDIHVFLDVINAVPC